MLGVSVCGGSSVHITSTSICPKCPATCSNEKSPLSSFTYPFRGLGLALPRWRPFPAPPSPTARKDTRPSVPSRPKSFKGTTLKKKEGAARHRKRFRTRLHVAPDEVKTLAPSPPTPKGLARAIHHGRQSLLADIHLQESL